jgi:putative addiction module component (TIGR02574 family)
MIAPGTGEVYFHDGLSIVAHCPVASLLREKAVLALPVEQRALLAESLLDSLSSPNEGWSEADEVAEVGRREREIDDGKVQPLTENEFWRQVEALHRQ